MKNFSYSTYFHQRYLTLHRKRLYNIEAKRLSFTGVAKRESFMYLYIVILY